ncbi:MULTISPECIES: hypothetical protein [unclassified Sphingomonas]|uniref:hypothetical protein n=1 Tax=unclassified Sphingomonas TaxID=196159 RepID=UPI000BCE9648|nr:MAG: hypothetical protein B7Y98_03495 [Sphingomonas sp. 32-62-10]
MNALDKRLRKIEERQDARRPSRWVSIIVDPRKGETVESVQAAYAAEHGSLDGVGVISWIVRDIIDPPQQSVA